MIFIDNLGHWVVSRISSVVLYTLELFKLAYLAPRAALQSHAQSLRTIVRVISTQIYFTGCLALPLISILALATGSVVVMQSSLQLSFLGDAGSVGRLMNLIVVREVGPLLTALIVIARSGTAVASELGNMRANREIEALESMGINPYSFLVFPRLIAGIISVLCLAFYFNWIAAFGGFLITRLSHPLSFSFYLDSLSQAFSKDDLIIFLIKNTFSGLIIFTVSCYRGLSVKQSPHEVPRVTTAAVVDSVAYVVLLDVLVTGAEYFQQLHDAGLV